MCSRRFFPVLLVIFFFAVPVKASASDADDGVALAALENASTSLGQAIGTVERQAGGKAFSAQAEIRNGVLSYWVDALENGKPARFEVSPPTGQIMASEKQGLWDSLFGEDGEVEGVSPIGLQKAVESVENALDAKVVHAEFDAEEGKTTFKVNALTEGGERKVVIDATTGKIVKAENGDETGE